MADSARQPEQNPGYNGGSLRSEAGAALPNGDQLEARMFRNGDVVGCVICALQWTRSVGIKRVISGQPKARIIHARLHVVHHHDVA